MTQGKSPKKDRVSVIVPTKDRMEDLRAFVKTLAAQTHKPDEFVVVDAGSTPGIEAMIKDGLQGSGIALVYEKSAPGTSLQRNIAIDCSKGDILFFFDDDVELEPDYVEKTLECFDLERTPPVGGVMGSMTNAPYKGKKVELVYSAFGLTHWTRKDAPKLYASGGVRYVAEPSTILDVPVTCGGIVAFRRACFQNERWAEYLPGYTLHEDVEVSFRIARNWTLVQTPFARAVHKISPVSRHSFPDNVSRLIYAKYWFVRRHRPKDLRHMSSFAWANLGLAGLYLLRGIEDEDPGLKAIVGGMMDGYRRCLRDWASD